MKDHAYALEVYWTGNDGLGTQTYKAYRRDYTIAAPGKPAIHGSSDTAFRGDAHRYNPEELLVASISSCHMLWYLHFCSAHGVVVMEYRDSPSGILRENADGLGAFVRVDLRPAVILASGDPAVALRLHAEAHRFCFIARSVNFPVELTPQVSTVSLRA
jgi:organic hydroperoxide reductase OsmC/OhrA